MWFSCIASLFRHLGLVRIITNRARSEMKRIHRFVQ